MAVPQISRNPIPLKCWSCDAPHSKPQDFCALCNAWTLPIETPTPRKAIEWTTFVIMASDSNERKGSLFRNAAAAILANQNVAVLGHQSQTDGTEKRVVFVHRKGGNKRVSSATEGLSASPRYWDDLNSWDRVWKTSEEVVGELSMVPTYSGKDLFFFLI